MTQTSSIDPTLLPRAIRDYLVAHAADDPDAAVSAFAADAVVTDEGKSFRGPDQIRLFLREAGAEFTYTTGLIGACRLGPTQWVATHRLEGDFPGGVADLDYRFTMDDDLIAELVIAPR